MNSSADTVYFWKSFNNFSVIKNSTQYQKPAAIKGNQIWEIL